MARDPGYNERLGRRGRVLKVTPEVVALFDAEREEMNRGKEGRRYETSDGLMEAIAHARYIYKVPFRQLRWLVMDLFGIEIPSYSTLCRRINKLKLNLGLESGSKDMAIAVDSSGIKVTNRGDWMVHKHGTKRKGFLKMHIAADQDTNAITAVRITDESSHDVNHFEELAEQSQRHGCVSRIYGDGAYDSARVFEYGYHNGIEIVVPVRKSSRFDTPSYPRRMAVRIQLPDPAEWRIKSKYGKRWRVESVISSFKSMFGEYVMAHKKENMVHELLLKVMFYNRIMLAP